MGALYVGVSGNSSFVFSSNFNRGRSGVIGRSGLGPVHNCAGANISRSYRAVSRLARHQSADNNVVTPGQLAFQKLTQFILPFPSGKRAEGVY